MKVAPAPIAKDHGHEVVRTPPYHPELQLIETCWDVVKNNMARNCDFTMENLVVQLEKSFAVVTAETCARIIERVRKKRIAFGKKI